MSDSQNRDRDRDRDRPKRPGARSDGPRRDAGGPADRRPNRSDGPRKPAAEGDRKDAAPRGHAPRGGASRDGGRDAGRTGGGRPPERGAWVRREERDPADDLRAVRPRHDDPELPDDVEASDLDRIARNELKTLSKDNAEGVAKHLVMAARLIEEFPALAHRHALSAARRAGRIAVVRETLAITAYATEDYALALRELRTYRRISGRNDQLPLMVDSERALGRPDRALELGRSVPRAELAVPVQVALAVAMSGARLDLGEPEAALAELEIEQLDPDTAYSYSAELFDAYAEVLEELGRTDDAANWRRRAERAADAFDETADDEVEIVDLEDDGADEAGGRPEDDADGAEAQLPASDAGAGDVRSND